MNILFLFLFPCLLHYGEGIQSAASSTSYEIPANCQGSACSYIATWTLDVPRDMVIFNLSASTTGYVAIGFSDTDSMVDSDIAIGGIVAGSPFATDRYASLRARPEKDTDIGGSNDITSLSLTAANGKTTFVFERPRNSTDANDTSLTECRYFLFAWGDSFAAGGVPGYHSTQRQVSGTKICIEVPVTVAPATTAPVTVTPCDVSPCQNGGTCVIVGTSYVCQCPEQNFGPNCEFC